MLCGLARNLWELVAARAFSGVGAGGMSTVVTILVSDHVSLEDRGMWSLLSQGGCKILGVSLM